MWAAVVGQCTLDGTCVQSANYPETYGPNQECTIEISEANAAPIVVEKFKTQRNADYLVVNGVKYSGRSGPHGVIPTGSITWSSDSRRQKKGWRLCMPDSRAPLPPTRLLEEVAEHGDPALALTASGASRRAAGAGGPAPPADPPEVEAEADLEADVEASSMVLGMIVVAAGGSLWTLCLWYVLQKRAPPPRRSGPVGSDDSGLRGTEVCIDISGDVEKDAEAPGKTETSCIHQTKELPGERSTALLPI
jgi:hypothetical protein